MWETWRLVSFTVQKERKEERKKKRKKEAMLASGVEHTHTHKERRGEESPKYWD